MPRANCRFLPDLVWHITHRRHRRKILLKFARDRRNYLHWLFEAPKRFGLCVLDYYVVTLNYLRLLFKDRGEEAIARSMQLVFGRMAQEYNRRKSRNGAFWEDHGTAIETDAHLHRCVIYIDLNMVRAGFVKHPQARENSGYNEIQNPRTRNRLIDLAALGTLCGFDSVDQLRSEHYGWVKHALSETASARDDRWPEAVAVGSEQFAEDVKTGQVQCTLTKHSSPTPDCALPAQSL